MLSGPAHTSERPAAPLPLAELEQLLADADEAAFLVAPRVLRRVLRERFEVKRLGASMPHEECVVVPRDGLLEIVDRDELRPPRPLPAWVILLSEPDENQLRTTPRDEVLRDYWRRLFHARIHVLLEDRLACGAWGAGEIRRRIDDIGQTPFDEIRQVLRGEDRWLPPRDDRSAYVEFVATFEELRHFAPHLLPIYFPGIDPERIAAMIAQDVDAVALLQATRLPGAAERPEARLADGADGADGAMMLAQRPEAAAKGALPVQGKRERRRLLQRAAREEQAGNVVRAAILYRRAAAGASRSAAEARGKAHAALDVLIDRLQAALGLSNELAGRWRSATRALLEHTTTAWFSSEARLLYDLQKVCVDHERERFRVDLWGWLVSLGQRPLQRRLPREREVLLCKHLKKAASRLWAVRLSPESRRRLDDLLHQAVHAAEHALRERFRPLVCKALDDVGLRPAHRVEQVARDKLIEELLDRAAHRGHFDMGDVRDAIARNQLKLPDLSGVGELVRGDRLLQSNRRLKVVLEGVYRPAEVYRRWLQRLSALAFANPPGRLLTRYVLLPFLGAFILLEGTNHLVQIFLPYQVSGGWVSRPVVESVESALHVQQPAIALARQASAAAWDAARYARHGLPQKFSLVNAVSITALGVVLLLLINSRRFRAATGWCLRRAARGLAGLRRLLVAVLLIRYWQAVLRSRWFVLVRRYVLKPALLGTLVWFLLYLNHSWWVRGKQRPYVTAAALFLLSNAVLNSRLGRDAEEIASEWLVRAVRRFGLRVITGLFWFIVDLFKTLLDAIDQLLYAVDEWLRFKTGERWLTLAAKAVLGLFWSVVTYLVRFAITVLVEPQFNPIKHFPVVTVSHKVLLPLIPVLASGLLNVGIAENKAVAYTYATTFIWCIPGLFGFLAWELKENWRIYAANRPGNLRPAVIGHHGETMKRYFRPGFHSGTVPKLYRKLRRAARKGQRRSVGRVQAALDDIRHTLHNFADRELLALLRAQPAWDMPLALGPVRLSTNSACLELIAPRADADSLLLAFEEQSGWLLADVVRPGWADRLDAPHRAMLRHALLGFYKSCHVGIVRQQLERLLAAGRRAPPPYDVSSSGLVLWLDDSWNVQVRYPFRGEGDLVPVLDERHAATSSRSVWSASPGEAPPGPRERDVSSHASSWEAVADTVVPHVAGGRSGASETGVLRPLPRQAVFFHRQPIAWDDWVACWDRPLAGAQQQVLLPEVDVLPPAPEASTATAGQAS
jgi:hypothetical protein